MGAAPTCGVSEAEYIAMRKLTASAEASATKIGALSTSSCRAVNCAAPAITTTEKLSASTTLSPASVATTPNSRANGVTTRKNGAPSRKPCQ